MNDVQKIINRFSIKLFGILTLYRFIAIMVPFLFIWGTIAIALRMAMGISNVIIMQGLLGSLPLLPVAVGMQFIRHPKKKSIAALLDAKNSAGGLLMTGLEIPMPDWQPNNPIHPPEIKWLDLSNCILLVLALLYITAAMMVPQVKRDTTHPLPFQIESLTARLNQKIDLLKEEEIISPVSQETLKTELKQLSVSAEGQNPAVIWESLDHLNERLQNKTAEYTNTVKTTVDALSQAQNMAEVLGQLPDSTKHDRQALNNELTDMIQRSQSEYFSPDNLFKGGLSAKRLHKQMTSAQIAKIQKNIKMQQSILKKRLMRLQQNKLVSRKMCRNAMGPAKNSAGDLARFIKKNAPQLQTDDIIYMCRKKGIGQGGIKRGRADAVMTWKEKTNESGTRFKPAVLPLTALPTDRENIIIGQSGHTPKQAETIEQSEMPSVITKISDSGGTPVDQTVLPRHRGAVRRYFNRLE